MNKKLLVLIILICLLGTGIVFMYRFKMGGGSAPNTAVAAETEPQQEKTASGLVYVSYAGTYLSLDENGLVCSNDSSAPKEIPEVKGVAFTRLSYGKAAEPEDPGALEYVLRVAADLQKNDITASVINYQDRMITVDVDNVKIKLGKNDNTDEKISDLNNFIDMVRGLRGTLYMQNGDESNYGYTFRASGE